MKILKKLDNFKFVEKYKIWFLMPMVILLIAACVFTGFAIAGKKFSNGINIGIDFSSGNILTVEIGQKQAQDSFKVNEKIISDKITSLGGKISYSQTTGSGNTMAIAVKYANFRDTPELQKEVNDQMVKELSAQFIEKGIVAADKENFINYESMGASASSDLLGSSILAIVIATLLILIYVVIRFKLWTGLAAIIALIHDVFMVIAFTIIFHIQINVAFIAAVITIISYSINDTIVIFDRVRENTKLNETETEKLTLNQLTNRSIRQTMQRSINTSLTTLLSIVLLAIIGVASIREFALPIIFGLVTGTFSSIFIAPPLYCLMANAAQKRKNNSTKIAPYSAENAENKETPKKVTKAKVAKSK